MRCVVFVVFLLTGGLAHGEGKFDPAARAKVIAPWIDEQTLAVAHLDLAAPVGRAVSGPDSVLVAVGQGRTAQVKQEAVALQQRLVRAGVKDVYVLFPLAACTRTTCLPNPSPSKAARSTVPRTWPAACPALAVRRHTA